MFCTNSISAHVCTNAIYAHVCACNFCTCVCACAIYIYLHVHIWAIIVTVLWSIKLRELPNSVVFNLIVFELNCIAFKLNCIDINLNWILPMSNARRAAPLLAWLSPFLLCLLGVEESLALQGGGEISCPQSWLKEIIRTTLAVILVENFQIDSHV